MDNIKDYTIIILLFIIVIMIVNFILMIRSKNKIIRIIFLVLCLMVGVTIFKLFNERDNQVFYDENIIIGRDKIKIETGEEFSVNYEISEFPKKIVNYIISDSKGIKVAEYYTKSDIYKRPEIKLISNNSKLKVYKVTDDLLIYQLAKDNFKEINFKLIENSRDIFNYPELLLNKEIEMVAKNIFAEKNWDGIIFLQIIL